QTGTTYTALVIPAEAQTGQAFLTLTVEGKSLTVTGIPAMEAGKSYTYPLTVGKDAMTVGEVTVEDWTSGELTENQGNAVAPPFADPVTHTVYINAGDIVSHSELPVQAMAGTGELHVVGPLTQDDLDCLTTTFHDSFTLFDLSQATAAEELTLNGNGKNGYFPQIETLVPGPVSHIANAAFSYAENLKTVDFSHSPRLISIGDYGFYITSLDSLDLSYCPKIQDLGTGTFQSISTLKSVNLSGCASLSQLGTDLFYNCSALENVDLSGCSNLTTIGSSAFSSCTSLKNSDFTALPNLTDIGDYAFQSCSTLEKIDFSQCPNLSTIGKSVFFDCSALKSIDFSGCTRLTSIGSFSFEEAPSLTDVYFGGDNPPADFSKTLSYSFGNTAGQCTYHLSTTAQGNSAWSTFVGKDWKSTVYDL
ncbi:MAG: leucine-rich repeat protein, partial [Paraprevotella sp.]|nr:leucine-rich repeat protein [Paraprevotella sp.]